MIGNNKGLKEWVRANPIVKEWHDKLALGSHRTAEQYASFLWQYWRDKLSEQFSKLDDWVREIKSQHENEDVKVKRKWGEDLERWLLTGTKLARGSRHAFGAIFGWS